jgi:tripartite ATP-independent transporter DctM subunit
MDPVLLGEILAVALFAAIIVILMLGYPVAFTLPGVAVLFALLGWSLGVFDLTYFNSLPLRYWGILTNDVLIAVPLFVVMGVLLERSKIAEDLLTTMGQLFGPVRGGLGISAIIVATLLAASTGIVGATVVTMGLISLPAMLAAGYDKRMASGLICASGTLGQIIPPSTILVVLAVVLQSAYSQAQMAKGNFQPETLSVGDLFAGAFLPGLLLSAMYILWVGGRAFFVPSSAPALPLSAAQKRALPRRVVSALAPPLLLIVAVLGSIIAGVATPTESASVGAIGALVLMLVRQLSDWYSREMSAERIESFNFWFWLTLLALLAVVNLLGGALGLLTLAVVLLLGLTLWVLLLAGTRSTFIRSISEASTSSLVITGMVFVIFFGASVFSVVFARLGGENLVHEFLSAMPGGADGALFVVMAIIFVLGFFLDPFEIIFIVVTLAAPVLLQMDVNPVWLAILIGINLQTSYLTPPFGFSLFYLRGVAPPQVTTGDIYLGIIPFVAIQLVCLALVWYFPALATWLPKLLYG